MLVDLFRARGALVPRSARRSRFRQPAALVQSLEERVLLMANAVGDEIRLNAQTIGRQETAGFQSSLDTAPDGTGVVVWTSQADARRSQEILGQRLDVLGRPVGDIFTISAAPGRQEEASVAVDDDGSFVVVWQRWKGDGSGWAVIGQRFNGNATKAGNEFRINATTRGDQEKPGVSYLENGNFVVTWQGRGSSDRQGVYARIFNDNGSPVTGEIVVSQISRGPQTNAVVSADPDGGFLVAWSGRGEDDRHGVYAQRFDETGSTLGSQFQVNTRERWSQEQPSASFASNGDFVIVWQSKWQDGWGWSVFGQRFLADGTRDGNEFLINETVKSGQLAPHVDYLQDRNFLVAWQGRGLGDRYGIYAREFGSNGKPTTGEFLVNTTTSRRQQSASVAATPQGYLVGWSGNGVGDRDGVFVRQIVSE